MMSPWPERTVSLKVALLLLLARGSRSRGRDDRTSGCTHHRCHARWDIDAVAVRGTAPSTGNLKKTAALARFPALIVTYLSTLYHAN